MADVYATSFGVLNYSGMLFNKGNTRTPFSSLIGSRPKTTNYVEFPTGQEYATGGGEQPEISENDSLIAPQARVVTRTQKTNVTQIFQKTVGVSYAKQSNMGTLSGINVANQVANPINELDFQIAAKLDEVNADIEYTFINGEFQKATSDATANKTRGMVNAIESNVLAMDGKPLTIWTVAEANKLVYESNGEVNGLVLLCDPTTLMQINADAAANGLTVVEASREINGISLRSVITPLGVVYLLVGNYLPAGTALLINVGVIAPVFQPVPGKGNFFFEELARVGAGARYQLFGQIGLDHGPEWYHAKFTGLKTTFDAGDFTKKVSVYGPTATVETDATITGATLDKTTVAADDTAQVSVASVNYNVEPATAATLSYLWQVRAKTGTVWTDLTSAYTGYNTATLTVKADDAEKHYRCKVTATGTATGTVFSNECTVEAAD
jgi:hypothetical protein